MPNRLRPYAFGFAQTINSIAAIIGTFSAGAFAEYASWAWSYRLNGIVYAIAGVSVFITYNPPDTAIRRSGNLHDILRSVDYFGILLFTGACASLIMALTWGGTVYQWSSGTILATLITGCMGLLFFGLYEWKLKKTDGILDHRLFETLNFPILCLVCLIDGMLLLVGFRKSVSPVSSHSTDGYQRASTYCTRKRLEIYSRLMQFGFRRFYPRISSRVLLAVFR